MTAERDRPTLQLDVQGPIKIPVADKVRIIQEGLSARQVPIRDLDLYREAAGQSGYSIEVFAQTGQPFVDFEPVLVTRSTKNGGRLVSRTQMVDKVVAENHVGILVHKGDSVLSFNPFNMKLNELYTRRRNNTGRYLLP